MVKILCRLDDWLENTWSAHKSLPRRTTVAQLFDKHTQTTSLIFIASTTASSADRLVGSVDGGFPGKLTPAHYFAAAVANH